MIKIANKDLIEFRKGKKLSSAEMARKIGISNSYYQKIEYGDRSPSFNFLKKFKSVFPDVNTDTIFFNFNHT